MEEKEKPIEKKEEQKKLTYEQLEQIAGNLQAQCQQLHNQLRDTQRVIAEFNEVGMLLDILDKADFFSQKFTERCANKIEEVITKALDNAEEAESKSGSN